MHTGKAADRAITDHLNQQLRDGHVWAQCLHCNNRYKRKSNWKRYIVHLSKCSAPSALPFNAAAKAALDTATAEKLRLAKVSTPEHHMTALAPA